MLVYVDAKQKLTSTYNTHKQRNPITNELQQKRTIRPVVQFITMHYIYDTWNAMYYKKTLFGQMGNALQFYNTKEPNVRWIIIKNSY